MDFPNAVVVGHDGAYLIPLFNTMVSSPTAAAQEYKLTLDELMNNNKTQINLLTILAEDYLQYASYIVDTIEKQIYTVPREQKLPILYVTDSILKNINEGPYKALFQKIIIKIFLHVFVNGDEKVRMSLYKLRQTWANNIFPASCLYKMDMEVNKEDKQWPITSPKVVGGAPAAPPVAAAKPSVPVSPAIHFNPKFLQKGGNTNNVESDPRRPRPPIEPSKKTVIEVKKEPPSDPQGPRDVLYCRDNIMSLPNSRPIKEEVEEPVPPQQAPKKVSPIVPAKRRGFEDNRAPPKKKRSPLPRDEDLRKRGPVVNHNVSNNRVPSPSVPAAPATALPGAHAFAVPPVIAAGPSGSPNINSPAFTESYPSSSQFSAAPSFTPMPPSTSSVFYPPPAASAPLPPAPTPMPSRPVEICDDGIKLEGIPANNRIFVDGKAHEVFYIEDSAVIERNGLPHRIYFSGPPRNVIIDGVAHMLHFGERKTVYIDGQPHVLRFGAPSKELYMGNYAFKGQFGGAPIIAIIDSVRHEIRLGGPAPEVKIEPDPAYDLTRFMPKIRGERGAPEPPKPAKPAENPFDLLRRLQMSGFLNKNAEEKPKDGKKAPAKETTPPPIPSEHTFDLVERRAEPGTSLRDFNMRLLKVRYTAIVDALHEKQRNACSQCGLRMELSGEKYERHLDWHVKKNLQTLERTSTSRPWYSNGKDWLGNEEDDIPGTSNPEEVKVEDEEPTPAISSKDAPNTDCRVCSEKFEEYYDEHDEIWKFKDTVVVGGMVVHVGCVQDVSVLEQSTVSCASVSDPDFVVEEKALKIVPSH